MTGILAGADVGGTKTLAVVARDAGGPELARVTGPGAAMRPGRGMAAAAIIGRVVRSALNQAGELRAAVLVVGVAGAGREEERQSLRDALRVEDLADRLVVTTDLELALVAGLGAKPGIVLLAGTGSVAVARLPSGDLVRAGGYGCLMGDDGGGYAIGRAGLRAVGRARDGRGPPTKLSDELGTALRVEGFEELIRWSARAEPLEVAALAPPVITQGRAGDPVAAGIVASAVQDLAAHVATLLPRFDAVRPVRVVLGGGLLQPDALGEAVRERLAALDGAAVDGPLVDPVRGALTLAARPV